MAGQIALCPATMAMLDSSPAAQSRLALRHVDRILAAMTDGGALCDVLLAICYVTRRGYIPFAQQEWRVALNGAKKVCDNARVGFELQSKKYAFGIAYTPPTTTSCGTCDLYFPTVLESKHHQYHSLGDATVAISFPRYTEMSIPRAMLGVWPLLTYAIVIQCYFYVWTWFKGLRFDVILISLPCFLH